MAKLSDFVTDARAIKDGLWVRVDPASFGDLEILSAGFTDEFLDAKTELESAASERLNIGPGRQLPNAEQRKINAELLERFLIKDVRNLYDEKNELVPISEFHRFMYLPTHSRLASAAWRAAGRVSNMTAKQLEQAVGNSVTLSSHTSNGQVLDSASPD